MNGALLGNTSKDIPIHVDFKSIGTPGKVRLMFEFLPARSLAVVAAVGLLCPGVRDVAFDLCSHVESL